MAHHLNKTTRRYYNSKLIISIHVINDFQQLQTANYFNFRIIWIFYSTLVFIYFYFNFILVSVNL